MALRAQYDLIMLIVSRNQYLLSHSAPNHIILRPGQLLGDTRANMVETQAAEHKRNAKQGVATKNICARCLKVFGENYGRR
jgi:hypothetical protein